MKMEELYEHHYEKVFNYALCLTKDSENIHNHISHAIYNAWLSGMNISRSEKDWLAEILKLLKHRILSFHSL